jgi:hypothetical protein
MAIDRLIDELGREKEAMEGYLAEMAGPKGGNGGAKGGDAASDGLSLMEGALGLVSASASASDGEEPSEGASKTVHYRIEAKAWIPQKRVVDPEEPIRVSDWLDTLTDLNDIIPDWAKLTDVEYEYSSSYHGDGHGDYDGDHRVFGALEFDWDGVAISGVKVGKRTGTTIRYWEWRAWFEVVGFEVFELAKGGDSESKPATPIIKGSGSGNKFSLSLAGKNALTIGPAPQANAELTGTLDPSGNLTINYVTDEFPSYGVRVIIDGTTVQTVRVGDVSGMTVTGVVGAASIGKALVSHSNTGTLKISTPSPVGRS